MEKMTIIVLAPIFIILFVIILQAIKSMLDLNGTSSFVLAACVSILAVMGMVRYLNDTIDVILLPYTAMAIAILLLLFLSVIVRYFKNTNVIDRVRKNNISKYDYEECTDKTPIKTSQIEPSKAGHVFLRTQQKKDKYNEPKK
jgi:predicted membrane protein